MKNTQDNPTSSAKKPVSAAVAAVIEKLGFTVPQDVAEILAACPKFTVAYDKETLLTKTTAAGMKSPTMFLAKAK
jgi:hypothetical protein